MTATLSALEHPQAPPQLVEESVDRRRSWALLAVLVLWVVGWAIFKGRFTLELPVAQLADVQVRLNELRDSVEGARNSNFFFEDVIGGLSNLLDGTYNRLQNIFSDAAFPRPVPEVGWLGTVALSLWVAYALAGLRIAVGVAVAMLAFGFLGYWESSLETLMIVGISVAACTVIGLPLGIWMARSRAVTTLLTPVLDVMQTMPSIAYLAPLVLFFGIGSASAIVATLIYALPPLVRISAHALRSVAPTTVEATTAMGSTPTQLLGKVQLPMARGTIIVGLNQTTMAALSMATIAALVNGPGLGQDVIQALETLDVGEAFVSGMCIVIMAIMLDRLTTAASERHEVLARRGDDPRRRRLMLAVVGVSALAAVYVSRTYLWAAEFPESPDMGSPLERWTTSATNWFVDVFGPATTLIKDFVSFNLLNPLQSLTAESPWWLMATVLLCLAYLLGGKHALLPTAVCIGVILGTGLWNDSMQTLAMTLVATLLVLILGVLVGVWMGRSHLVDTIIRPVLDALQTLPAFVYLVPALALFDPTRFTAIVAAVAYAAPVAIKIIADGIRGVSPTTVEAAEATGTSGWQMIRKVQLPMARGATVLATNQGLLFVLAAVVIGGLVGGGGLGFLVVQGFSQSEQFGKGLAAGIAITALGVMLDRISVHTAARYGRPQA